MPKRSRSFKLSKRIRKVRSCPQYPPDERILQGADVCGVVQVHRTGYVNLTVTEVRLRDGRSFRRGNGLEELLVCAAHSFAHRQGRRATSPKSWVMKDQGVQLGAHVTLRSKHKTFERRKVCMQVERLVVLRGRRRDSIVMKLHSDLFDDKFLHVTMAQLPSHRQRRLE